MGEKVYSNVSDQELVINIQLRNALYETARWGKILAVVGFIFVGLTLVLAYFMQNYLEDIYESAGISSVGLAVFTAGFYALFAFIYFFPALYLYNFSRQMQAGLKSQDQELVNNSFKNLRILFKFMGILMIVTLIIYAVSILVMGVGATELGNVNP